jgi:hypothetical protein
MKKLIIRRLKMNKTETKSPFIHFRRFLICIAHENYYQNHGYVYPLYCIMYFVPLLPNSWWLPPLCQLYGWLWMDRRVGYQDGITIKSKFFCDWYIFSGFPMETEVALSCSQKPGTEPAKSSPYFTSYVRTILVSYFQISNNCSTSEAI